MQGGHLLLGAEQTGAVDTVFFFSWCGRDLTVLMTNNALSLSSERNPQSAGHYNDAAVDAMLVSWLLSSPRDEKKQNALMLNVRDNHLRNDFP